MFYFHDFWIMKNFYITKEREIIDEFPIIILIGDQKNDVLFLIFSQKIKLRYLVDI